MKLSLAPRSVYPTNNPLHSNGWQTSHNTGSPLACSMAGTGGGGGQRPRLGQRDGTFHALRTMGTMPGLQAIMGHQVLIEMGDKRISVGENVKNIVFGDGNVAMNEPGQGVAIPSMEGPVARMQRDGNTWTLRMDQAYQNMHPTHGLWLATKDEHRIAIGPNFSGIGATPELSSTREIALQAGSYRLVFANNFALDVLVPGYLTADTREKPQVRIDDIPYIRPLDPSVGPHEAYIATYEQAGAALGSNASFLAGELLLTRPGFTVISPAIAGGNFTVRHPAFGAPTIVDQRANRQMPKSFGKPFSLPPARYQVSAKGDAGVLTLQRTARSERRFVGTEGFVHSALVLFDTIPHSVPAGRTADLTVHLVMDQATDGRILDVLLPDTVPPQYDGPVDIVPATFDPAAQQYTISSSNYLGSSVQGHAGAMARRFANLNLRHAHAAWFQVG